LRISGRKRRIAFVAAGVAALLLLVQVLTYVFFAEAAMPRPVIRWAWRREDAGSGFVCLSDRSLKALSPVHRHRLDEVLQQEFGTVYYGEADIPSEQWVLDPADASRRIGLKNGWILRWLMSGRGLFWFSAESRYWVGNEGAGSKVETFVWFFGTWLRVWTTLGPVS